MAIRYGMGPGQSRAMAGNTGLASATEKQANTISRGLRNLGKDSSFKSIGQNIGEIGSKYRRPANVEDYARKMDMINQGFANEKPATTFVGPDGIPRINFNGTGLKDAQGRTILSMMNPQLNASQPTFSQVFGIKDGDIRRALTGYNSIKYDEPSGLYDSRLTGSTDQFGNTIGQANSQISMQRTPGMMEQGGGILSMLANVAKPGLGFLINGMLGGGNSMLGGVQKLIDYRPQMIEPRDDGFKGAIDRGSNLFKALLGGTPYDPQASNSGVLALPSINNNNIIDETVTTDYGLDPVVLNALINRRDANTNRAR